MAAFSGFYKSHGSTPSGDARGIVSVHRHGHRNGQQSGHILHRCFVFCRPGSRRGDTEQLVAQWRHLVAFMKAQDLSSIGRCARCCTIAPTWLLNWPATEVYLFVVTAFFVWSNIAKRPCYGPFNSLTAKCILVGTKNSLSEDLLLAKHTSHTHPHHDEPFSPLAPWFPWMNIHHPWEPLRKGLDKAAIEGFSIKL